VDGGGGRPEAGADAVEGETAALETTMPPNTSRNTPAGGIIYTYTIIFIPTQ
jgi:hypothetical protein